MGPRNFTCITFLVLLPLLGCENISQRAPFIANMRQQRKGVPVQYLASADPDDDAQDVILRCGTPTADTILTSDSPYNNGPVRRLYYRRKRPVMLEFIPGSKSGATTDWRFDDAKVRDELDIITADRLDYFLPCAAHTLKPNY
jgi:hypothetical protein